MPRRFSTPRVLTVAAVLLAGIVTQPSFGQEAQTDEQLLGDFIHYTRIHVFDAAASKGQELLDRGLTAREFVDLIEDSIGTAEFEAGVLRAMRAPELEDTASSLLKTFEKGKLEMVRDPAEIARNISFLTGGLRASQLARERLAAAGEYAMPQLLEALIQRQDPTLQGQVGRLVQDMGRQAITPLVTAVFDLEPASQERVVDLLGLIPYRTSLPYLVELSDTSSSRPVQTACNRAIERIGLGSFERDAAGLYRNLAESYYSERLELTSFPGEAHQLLWDFNPAIGLTATAIRTPVYHEAMAMRSSERSLALGSADDSQTVALWLASNFSREIDTPEEYENPVYGPDRRDAMYFAVASGAGVGQLVLGRAIDDNDTPLARRAIAAIERTAGGAALWSTQSDRKPLLEALRYPNRRVQYEAALALGAAQPQTEFDGSRRVVPILASAIRDASAKFAIVMSSDRERYQALRSELQGRGFSVLPYGRTLTDIQAPMADTPGIDLVIASMSTNSTTQDLIESVRAETALAATPILALVEREYASMDLRYERDAMVMVRPTMLSSRELAAAVDQVIERASGGPITRDEADNYASRSLDTLRDLALASNPVFDVADAAVPLMGALNERAGSTKLRVAEVLSRIDQKRAQVALMDSSLNAAGPERIALFEKVSGSAKRYGNQLEPRQIDRLIEVALDGDDEEATSAAALMGALSLPNENLIPLIVGE